MIQEDLRFCQMAEDAKIKKQLLKAWHEEKPRMWLHSVPLKPFAQTARSKRQVLRSRRLRVIDLLRRL